MNTTPHVGDVFGAPPLELWTRMTQASIEVSVLAFIVLMLIRLGHVRSPRLISFLWLLVLVKPMLTLCLGPILPLYDVVERVAHSNAGPRSDASLPLVSWLLHIVVLDFGAFLTIAWIVGVGVSIERRLRGRAALNTMLTRSKLAPVMLEFKLREITRELHLSQVPDLRIVDQIESPVVVGYVDPTVLLPGWMTNSAHAETAEWALRHELNHWRRGDTIANALRQLCLTLFFFHPVIIFAARKWEEAAEFACDRATAAPERARDYANALFETLQRSRGESIPEASLSAVRSHAGRRIRALVSPQIEEPRPSTIMQICLATALIVAASVGSIHIDIGYAETSTTRVTAQGPVPQPVR